MSTIKWKKPSGIELETNDMPATVEYCASIGWERIDGEQQGSESTFADMKVAELKEALEAAEIEIPEGAKKADLVALLEAADAE